jgi:hypothetical protein
MATAPVLDLTTLVTPIFVRIDGELYELRRPGALSLEEIARIDLLRPQVLELQAKLAEASSADVDVLNLSRLLVALCAIVLAAPADVQARLSDQQRLAILQAFQSLPAPQPPTTAARTPRRRARPIGARSSRASRASTGAVQ